MSILIKKKSKFRGLYLPERKITEKKSIETLPIPEKITLPLIQNIGAPCEFIIEKGDEVKTGQKIADSKSYVSSPIHSSISGKVKKISKILNPASGMLMDAATIASDGEDRWVETNRVFDIGLSQDYNKLRAIIDSLGKDEILSTAFFISWATSETSSPSMISTDTVPEPSLAVAVISSIPSMSWIASSTARIAPLSTSSGLAPG